jgi:mono/diheme cytochrome c family protein
MPDSEEDKSIEIGEEKVFAGGEITSVEPMASGDAAHGVHGSFHGYSGGQILERTDTKVSLNYWMMSGLLFVAILCALTYFGVVPFLHPTTAYDLPAGLSTAGYQAAEQQMAAQQSYVAMTSPSLIDMYELPRPKGQDLKTAISAGSDAYQVYCIGCHGPNQDGNGPNSVSLDPKPQNLRNKDFMQALSYQRIWTSVHKGVPGTAMPRWENVIPDDKIQDIICYVLSLTAPSDPTTGAFIRPSPQEIAGSSQSGPTNLGATYTAPQ